MTDLLFRPFNFNKWVILGFCAWLGHVSFVYNSNPGSNFGSNFGSSSREASLASIFSPESLQSIEWTGPLIFLLFILVVLVIILVYLFAWVTCRFNFIFLHNILYDRLDIAAPWKQFRRQGNSLFLTYLLFGLLAALLIITLMTLLFSFITTNIGSNALLVFLPLFIFLILLPFLLVMFIIAYLVIPVMYCRGMLFLEAWSYVIRLLARNIGSLLKFLLFCIALQIALSLVVAVAILATCCLLIIPLILPVLSGIILLPVHVFFRYLGPEFLAALDPELNMFPPLEIPQPASDYAQY